MIPATQIGELFGKYAKGGYITEEGFILAVISIIGRPPTQEHLSQLGFQDNGVLTYREFCDAMKECIHAFDDQLPSHDDLVSALRIVFSKDALTLSEFVATFRHNAAVLNLDNVTDDLLVGLYQYAGGLETISLTQFVDFIHIHAGRY